MKWKLSIVNKWWISTSRMLSLIDLVLQLLIMRVVVPKFLRRKETMIWARSCENVSYAICKQQMRRSACESAQSDQHLCCSSLDSIIPLVSRSEILRFLLVSLAEQSGLTVTWSQTPEDTFSLDEAHLFWLVCYLNSSDIFFSPSWKFRINILNIFENIANNLSVTL